MHQIRSPRGPTSKGGRGSLPQSVYRRVYMLCAVYLHLGLCGTFRQVFLIEQYLIVKEHYKENYVQIAIRLENTKITLRTMKKTVITKQRSITKPVNGSSSVSTYEYIKCMRCRARDSAVVLNRFQ